MCRCLRWSVVPRGRRCRLRTSAKSRTSTLAHQPLLVSVSVTSIWLSLVVWRGQLVWRGGSGVGHANEVKLRLARLILGLVTTGGGSSVQVIIKAARRPCPLSLVIPSWISATTAVDGYSHRWGRNGEFCVALGPVTRTAGLRMLAESGLPSSAQRSKVMSSLATHLTVCA